MTMKPPEIHEARLVDLPLVRRLAEDGIVLDSELLCTRETMGASNVILSHLLPQRGVTTLVGRVGDQRSMGQFRLRSEGHLAQMVFIAPTPPPGSKDTPLLHLLDAIAFEAGKRGAHMVMAEVDVDSPLFETLRTANFAVYARQEIWQWAGDEDLLNTIVPVPLDDLRGEDEIEINALHAAVIPSLIQPVAAPSPDSGGWVYRRDGRLQAHIAFVEGRNGGYVMPFIRPELSGQEVKRIFAGVVSFANTMAKTRRTARTPIYVCVRRYQQGLEPALEALGFEPVKPQAVMVRHIAVGIRHPQFARTYEGLEAIPQSVRPPTRTRITLLSSGENSSWYGTTHNR